MPQKRMPRRMAIFNESFADISNLDGGDIDAILSTNGLVPLSKMEREFLDDLELSLKISTDKLVEIREILGSNDGITEKEAYRLMDELDEIIQDNNGILGLGVSNLGHGLKLKRIG